MIPGIRAACPSERGRTFASRSRTSVERPPTSAKSKRFGNEAILEPLEAVDRLGLTADVALVLHLGLEFGRRVEVEPGAARPANPSTAS